MRFHPQPVVALLQQNQHGNIINNTSNNSNLNFITQENGNVELIDSSLIPGNNPTVNLNSPNDLTRITTTIFHQSNQIPQNLRQTITKTTGGGVVADNDYSVIEADTNYISSNNRRTNLNSTKIYNNLNELSLNDCNNSNTTTNTDDVLNNHRHQQPFKVKLLRHQQQNDNDLKFLNGNNCNIVISRVENSNTINCGDNHEVGGEDHGDDNDNDGKLNESNLKTLISTVYGTNQSYNDNLNTYFGRRENLTKLDLDKNNRIHHHNEVKGGDSSDGNGVEAGGGDGGIVDDGIIDNIKNGEPNVDNKRSSIYSESSPDDSFLDGEEEEEEEDDEDVEHFSPVASSCASLNSPEPSFTRGIINPNYPGFQHLAHTLSEHFTDHHFEHFTDSEGSDEFDIELVDDNDDDDLDDNGNTDNNGNDEEFVVLDHIVDNDKMETDSINENGNQQEENNKNLLMKLEPKIYCEKFVTTKSEEGNQDQEESEECGNGDGVVLMSPSGSSTISSDEYIANKPPIADYDVVDTATEGKTVLDEEITVEEIKSLNRQTILDGGSEGVTCDLATYLKQYETQNDVQTLIDNDDGQIIRREDNEFAEKLNNIDEQILECLTPATPDILIQNETMKIQVLNATDDCVLSFGGPDLLSNIGNAIEDNSPCKTFNQHSCHRNDNADDVGGSHLKKGVENCDKFLTTTTMKSPPNTFISRSTTPVDIVGDFKQEIEREIGLIFDGYKNGSSSQKPNSFNDDANKTQEIIENVVNECREDEELNGTRSIEVKDKMLDAALSNAKEIISLVSQNELTKTITSTPSTATNTTNSSLTLTSSCSSSSSSSSLETTVELSKPEIDSGENNLSKINDEKNYLIINNTKFFTNTNLNNNQCMKNTPNSVNNVQSPPPEINNFNNIKLTAVPTAIVKPKYQKSSHDDRQLPPTALWYHISTPNDSNRTTSTKKVLLTTTKSGPSTSSQTHNSLNRLTTTTGTGVGSHGHKFGPIVCHDRKILCGNQKELINSRYGQSEKDVDCSRNLSLLLSRDKNLSTVVKGVGGSGGSGGGGGYHNNKFNSVAIVQPRKKNKMEINSIEKLNKNSLLLYDEQQLKQQTVNNLQHKISYDNNNTTTLNNSNCKNLSNINNNYNNNNIGLVANGGGGVNGVGQPTSHTTYSSSFMKKSNLSDKEIKRNKKIKDNSANFDVYNIETALPEIDLEAIENHLKAAKEEERRRRNDREEIRRRLAMGNDDDYFGGAGRKPSSDKPARKPSLQSRLQSGMNLQICFMNDTVSDNESPSSDSESCPKLSKSSSSVNSTLRGSSTSIGPPNPYSSRPLSVNLRHHSNGSLKSASSGVTERKNVSRPVSLNLGPPIVEDSGSDFFTKQARLQIEARMALAQAKDMAHMQMEMDRQKQKESPITGVIRKSMEKIGIIMPPEKRRVSRQMLTDMNVAQLQIIVNELHTQIEVLNENLVQYLMERDELHMSQDSMLVDIEDLTRYLGDKEQNVRYSKISLSSSTSSFRNGKLKTALQNKEQQLKEQRQKLSRSSTSSASLSSSSSTSVNGITTSSASVAAAVADGIAKSTSPPTLNNIPSSDSQNSIASSSSSSQALQNKFLRIASLVKK